MKYNKITRRYFLEGVGGYMLALPILPSLLASEAEAQSSSVARFVSLFTAFGQQKELWMPSVAATTRPPGVPPGLYVKIKALSEISGPISQILDLPELGPAGSLRGKINLLNGLGSVPACGHNISIPLAAGGLSLEAVRDLDGALSYPSIDALMAQSPRIYESPAHRLKYLLLSQTRNYYPLTFANRVGDKYHQVSPINSPQAAFDLVFGPLLVPSGEADARAVSRRSIVDRVFEDYVNLKNNRRISSQDRTSLEAHLEFLHALQGRVAAETGGASGSCSPMPTRPSDAAVARPINADSHTRMNIDIIVAALRCGLTRVVTLTMHDDVFGQHHDHSHNAQSRMPQLLQINRRYAEHVVYFLNQLNSIDEGSGRTLLDNCMVLWTNEMGVGGGHQANNLPLLLAGGSGAPNLNTGYYIDFRQEDRPIGGRDSGEFASLPYNQLLMTIMSAMGLVQSDWEFGGQAGYGNYDPVQPDRIPRFDTSDAARRRLLPFLKRP